MCTGGWRIAGAGGRTPTREHSAPQTPRPIFPSSGHLTPLIKAAVGNLAPHWPKILPFMLGSNPLHRKKSTTFTDTSKVLCCFWWGSQGSQDGSKTLTKSKL